MRHCACMTRFSCRLRLAVMIPCWMVVAACATGLFGIPLAQSPTDEPSKTLHISGRLVDSNHNPVSLDLRMARWDPDGFKDERPPTVGQDGRFTFLTAPSNKYRFYLPSAWGVKSHPKIGDTSSGKDIDLGDVVVERCTLLSASSPQPPNTPVVIGDLKPEQVIIEPQESVNPYRSVADLPPSTYKPNNVVELPPCWSVPTLDNRSEWESSAMVEFDRFVTVESFVGGTVKVIRVIRHDPRLTPLQIREEVQRVWRGSFRFASDSIMWSEGNRWNIQAAVEFEDGKRASLLMDGWIHVQVEDRAGKYWFVRLSPAQ